MESDAERFRMEHAGLVARSAQGHAAKGMKIKDQEDMWISIQHNTFKNWVNVQLRDTGLRIDDLSEDLKDGVALVTLVETLQKRRLPKIKRVLNQHQALENVSTALNAISQDGIKLVNIGNVDIVNGNLKLILGLIWSLIMHYQIGQTKFPPKKKMLAWLKAVLPECKVTNFTSDWNSGVYLCALLDYCKPGLFSHWKHLNPHNAVDNCKRGMELAHKEFQIPMVLEPEYLASPYLDDLSGMTFLSYFMKEGGPGYKATLNWVRKQMPEKDIKNFTTDWNDGHNLGTLVKKLGGPVRGFKNMPRDQSSWEDNLRNCFEGGKKLGVEPVLAASDMSKRDVDHLGPMAYIAYYQWVQPRKGLSELLKVKCDIDNVRVNNPVPFQIDFLSKEVNLSEIKVEVTGPLGLVKVDLNLGPRGGKGSFVPKEVGFYELNIYNESELVDGCPYKIRALPDVSKIQLTGLDPCALGSIVEVLINSNGAGGVEIDVSALSPTNRTLHCPLKEEDGVYAATFQPDEVGEWSISVSFEDENIQGSPFSCQVYDPNQVKLRDLDEGPLTSPGQPYTFVVDTRGCGWGEAKVDVTLDGRSQPSRCIEVDRSYYEVTFTPFNAAKYKIYVYFNGHEVKGSPFHLYIGMDKPLDSKKSKSKKKKIRIRDKASPDPEPIVKEYKSTIESPLHRNNSNHSTQNDYTMTNHSSETNIFDRSSRINKLYDDIDYKYSNNYNSSSLKKKDYVSQTKSYTSPTARLDQLSHMNRLSLNSEGETNLDYEPAFDYKSSYTIETPSTRANFILRSSISPPPSPRSPLRGSLRNTPIRDISPPAQMPDSPSGLSSPAKVLQITQNAAQTEGDSFFYSSVAKMKILPSTY